MPLPACLDPNWGRVNPDWNVERRFTEVILHGPGCLSTAVGLRLWEGNPAFVPFRKRIWLNAAACQVISNMPNITVTKLRESDEIPQ